MPALIAEGGRPPRGIRGILTPCTARLLIGAVLLPNALAWIAAIWIATTPRIAAIALYALVAILCSRMPPVVTALAFVAVTAIDILLMVAPLFFFEIDDVGLLIGHVGKIDLLASPQYSAMLLALLIFLVANVAFLTRSGAALAAGSRPVLGAVIVLVMLVDVATIDNPNSDFGPVAGAGQPFESAVARSGFDEVPATSVRPDVLMIVVESLGVLSDSSHRQILFSAFEEPEIRRLFAVRYGTSTFFGHTPEGELRELCGSRADFRTIIAGPVPHCLPERFAVQGYSTLSVHGFTSGFFDRASWYPRIGFERSLFPETFPQVYPRMCGSTFAGPCDVDLARTIEARLATRSAGRTRPDFIYWLTLNSHVPVRPNQATPRHACETGGPFGDPEVCAVAEIWEDLFEAVAGIARAHPRTEILLVGDHAPPFLRRSARRFFEPDRVQWVRLTPKPDQVSAQ